MVLTFLPGIVTRPTRTQPPTVFRMKVTLKIATRLSVIARRKTAITVVVPLPRPVDSRSPTKPASPARTRATAMVARTTGVTLARIPTRAEVAQSVEHMTENHGVASSILALGTIFLATIPLTANGRDGPGERNRRRDRGPTSCRFHAARGGS